MKKIPLVRQSPSRMPIPLRPGRHRSGAAAALVLAVLAMSGCAGGAYAPDNRNPDMRHGNIERPGSRAADNQGEAGQSR